MKKYNVAVVGATGAVGQEMVKTLQKRDFPVANLRCLASYAGGRAVEFKGQKIPVEKLTEKSFAGIEIALFSIGAELSKQFAPIAAEQGTFVIDNSNAWRMDPDKPLVVPEINPHALSREKKIIANPNCSTIQMVVVLNPIHKVARIKRVVVATYQAVSGAGHAAIDELKNQTEWILHHKLSTINHTLINVFPHQIAFNCFPQIDVFLKNGYTKEEMKMVNETQKIMESKNIKVTATCVRVPVFRGHSEAVNIETEKKISTAQAREILARTPGVVVVDEPGSSRYPLPIDGAERYETYVGRIREDESIPNGLNLWIVSDNLLKGAALNAVQIAEELLKRKII